MPVAILQHRRLGALMPIRRKIGCKVLVACCQRTDQPSSRIPIHEEIFRPQYGVQRANVIPFYTSVRVVCGPHQNRRRSRPGRVLHHLVWVCRFGDFESSYAPTFPCLFKWVCRELMYLDTWWSERKSYLVGNVQSNSAFINTGVISRLRPLTRRCTNCTCAWRISWT